MTSFRSRDSEWLPGLRIAYVITRSDAIGGAHVHVSQLARHFGQRGADVEVFVGGAGTFVDRLVSESIPCHRLAHLVRPLRPLTDLRGLLELRSALESFRPDLISAHSAKAGALARIVGRSMAVPVIYTAHGWPFTEGVPWGRRLLYWLIEKLVSPLSSRVVTVSEFDRQLGVRLGIADDHSIRTIRNGMPELDGSIAEPASEPARMIMVARFDEQKDHETLLRALARNTDREWTLDLVGDGPNEAQARDLARELGIGGRIRFLGGRNDVPQLLAEAQVFFLVSRWEGLPRSIIEAMRAGLPIIASDVGGVRELVEDEVEGLIVPRGDEGAVAHACRRLLSSPASRARMGRQARRRFLKSFEWTRMLRETEDLYREVLRL